MLLAFQELTLVLGFIAADTGDVARFAYFLFALIAFLPVLKLIFDMKEDSTLSKFKWVTLIVYLIYPIIWILATGINKMCVDSEIISYCALDVIAKAIVGVLAAVYGDSLPAAELSAVLKPLGALPSFSIEGMNIPTGLGVIPSSSGSTGMSPSPGHETSSTSWTD